MTPLLMNPAVCVLLLAILFATVSTNPTNRGDASVDEEAERIALGAIGGILPAVNQIKEDLQIIRFQNPVVAKIISKAADGGPDNGEIIYDAAKKTYEFREGTDVCKPNCKGVHVWTFTVKERKSELVAEWRNA